VLQEAELSGQPDSENNLGGSSVTTRTTSDVSVEGSGLPVLRQDSLIDYSFSCLSGPATQWNIQRPKPDSRCILRFSPLR
jgi:hypothetical protein